MKLTKKDIGKKFRCVDGGVVTITDWNYPEPEEEAPAYVEGLGWYYEDGRFAPSTDEYNKIGDEHNLIERIEEDMKIGYYEDEDNQLCYVAAIIPDELKDKALNTIYYNGWKKYSDGQWDSYGWREEVFQKLKYIGKELPNHTIKVKNKKGKWIELEISRESFESITSEI